MLTRAQPGAISSAPAAAGARSLVRSARVLGHLREAVPPQALRPGAVPLRLLLARLLWLVLGRHYLRTARRDNFNARLCDELLNGEILLHFAPRRRLGYADRLRRPRWRNRLP